MKITHGQQEQIKFGIFSGKEYRGLLAEFPDGQIFAGIVVTDEAGTREHVYEITSSRELALSLINTWWVDLEKI